ncbi:MAG: formate dehydrogenase accessory protein FdhE [Acidobacteria bacterium]|nr:formate dehydrogenase accessory protein FdhE [Acidobacteriota bacterium]
MTLGRRQRSTIHPRWALRARRARTLIADRPHTAPLLQFYLAVLELQTAVCATIDVSAWSTAVERPAEGASPRLQLERLPVEELSVPFAVFCRNMPDSAPTPVAEAAGAVTHAHAQRRADLLLSMLTGDDLATHAEEFDCETAPLAFLPRAFLSPIAEGLAARVSTGTAATTSVCPRCGWPPLVSRLEDTPHTQGVRRLHCALCAEAWTFPRAVCPACGVSGDKGLEFHVDEGQPHVRIEACQTCRCYLKSIDLRVLGVAEPLVDDLATPELDLWATGQGLEKIVPNLLGL